MMKMPNDPQPYRHVGLAMAFAALIAFPVVFVAQMAMNAHISAQMEERK
jgi:hypothetical protein